MAVSLDPAQNTTQQRLLGLGLLHHDNFQDHTPSNKPIHCKIPFFTKHLQHPGRIYRRVDCSSHSVFRPLLLYNTRSNAGGNDYAILKIQQPLTLSLSITYRSTKSATTALLSVSSTTKSHGPTTSHKRKIESVLFFFINLFFLCDT